MQALDFSVQAASYSCPDGNALNLVNGGKRMWKGGTSCPYPRQILLRLAEKSLLSIVRIHNGGTSMVDIEICSGSKKKFTSIKEALRLPLWRNYDIPIGHLPCRYVRISASSGGSHSVSIMSVTLIGVRSLELEPDLQQLLLS